MIDWQLRHAKNNKRWRLNNDTKGTEFAKKFDFTKKLNFFYFFGLFHLIIILFFAKLYMYFKKAGDIDMKKPVVVISLCAVCAVLIVMLITQVLAATYVNIQLSSTVSYTASEIGAKIYGIQSTNINGSTTNSFITMSGSGSVDGNGIYNESGHALEFSNITASANANFVTSSDTMSLYLFVKNKGDRYIVPYIALDYDSQYLSITQSAYYFDSSAGNIDPVALRESGNSAASIINSVNSATKTTYPINSYVDNMDTYYLRLDFVISSSPGVSFVTQSTLNLAFMADVQYDTENEHLLTVSQPINQVSTAWTKVGYNANLNAKATKIETNSATVLKNAYDSRDANGNTSNTHNLDDYIDAVVYKDIDVVNVDIKSGEIIGKLSDENYPFEWYGGSVTLPSGTTLASGRVLTKNETFTVDCYTYYPTMYVRRWMVGDTQYITISDQSFPGATKIDAYYTGTFESTIFNPDKTVATNSLAAIIPRSYSYWWTPTTNASSSHLQTYYGFGTLSGSTTESTQAVYLGWANNLTTEWQNYLTSNPSMAEYIDVSGMQGENYHVFIQNLLYLVKYADNNGQAMVGYGNTYTRSLYQVSGISISTPGGMVATGGNWQLAAVESERGGGAIGLKGNAGGSAGEGLTFDNAGMAYTYSGSTPYYSQEFLTYSTGDRKFILDGYVGSDKYTGVWCLGMCDPWGNVWTWVFGAAVLHDESAGKAYAYVNFDDYDCANGNYITSDSTDAWETQDARFIANNYSRMTYNVPTVNGYYRYMGVSVVDSNNGIQSLIGLPTSASSTGGGESAGLSDYLWSNHMEAASFGVLRGGSSNDTTRVGALYYAVNGTLTHINAYFGFRSMLIN